MTEGAFFQDLALLMAVAGSASFIFTRFKWPKVIGYILVGILLSRNTWGGSFLVDEQSVQTNAQLGIVFLRFSIGLGTSLSEMRAVGRVTLTTALLDTIMMIWLGFTIGRNMFGWGAVPSLFLGAAICDSATTLLAKIIDEMGWRRRPFVRYVLGTSLCEDVVCVGVIALVTGFVHDENVGFAVVARSLGSLAIFFVATIVFGLVLVPRFLNSVAKRGDDETLLLTLLGCCFFVTYIAYRLDFSLALGAFLVGVLGAGADVRQRLAHLVDPLRSMFAAVFFVSIGLLVNPLECWHHLPAILFLSAVVIVGKLVNCTVGAVACGLEVKPAIQTGFSLAQIGEFAYMVALLYISLTGDFTKPMYQIVVGVSLITTLANPWMIRVSDRVGDWAERACPVRLAKALEGYRGFLDRYRASSVSFRREKVRAQIAELLVIAVLELALAIVFTMLARHDWSKFSPFFDANKRIFFCFAMNAIFLAILPGVFRIAQSLSASFVRTVVGAGEARWQLAFLNIGRFAIMSTILAISFLHVVLININVAPEETWARITIAVVLILAGVFGWSFFVRAGRRAAKNFDYALRTDERLAAVTKEVTFAVPETSVARLDIPALSPAVGSTVGSLNIRAKTGVVVAEVMRGNSVLRQVGPDLEFRAGDQLVVIGDGRQVAALKDLLGITS